MDEQTEEDMIDHYIKTHPEITEQECEPDIYDTDFLLAYGGRYPT